MAPKKSTLKLSEALEVTLDVRWNRKDNAHIYRSQVQSVIDALGDIKLSEIDRVWLERVRTLALRPGILNSTANKSISAINSVLHLNGVAQRVETYSVDRAPVVWFTDEELAAVDTFFQERVRNQMAKVVYVMMRETGTRGASELDAMTWGDVDFGARRITLRNRKGRRADWKDRTVPMTSKAERALSWLYSYRKDGEESPFNNSCARHSPRWIYKPWNRLSKALFPGREGIRPYCMRHTYAMRLLKNGINIPTISAMLGHRSVQTTMQYLHVGTADADNVLTALEKATTNAD